MKKLLVLILLLTVSCGYKIEKTIPCKVFVKNIENQTPLAGFDNYLLKNLDEYIYSYLSGKTKNENEACAKIRVTITSTRKKAIQSGRDNRATAEIRTITLNAEIVKGKVLKKYTKNFNILNRYSTKSELYVDDTEEVMDEVSKKMAFQVVSWIMENRH